MSTGGRGSGRSDNVLDDLEGNGLVAVESKRSAGVHEFVKLLRSSKHLVLN